MGNKFVDEGVILMRKDFLGGCRLELVTLDLDSLIGYMLTVLN